MTNETVEKAKADAKKAETDIGNKMAHAKLMQRLMSRIS